MKRNWYWAICHFHDSRRKGFQIPWCWNSVAFSWWHSDIRWGCPAQFLRTYPTLGKWNPVWKPTFGGDMLVPRNGNYLVLTCGEFWDEHLAVLDLWGRFWKICSGSRFMAIIIMFLFGWKLEIHGKPHFFPQKSYPPQYLPLKYIYYHIF